GSGGLADILASAQDEKWSCNDVNNELKKLEESEEESFEDSDDENFNSREQVKQHSNAGSVIKNVILSEQDYKTLCAITSVFEPDLTLADYGLGRTILLSILKVYPEKKWKLLKLCVQLGCFDVAKKYVLQDKTSRNLSLPVVQSAFILNRINFIEYFIRIGTFEVMQEDESVMSSIVTDSRAMSFSDNTLWKAKDWYKTDFFGVYDHLFRQCLMSNKIELSKLFWLRTKNPLGTLLLAAAFLKRKAKVEKNHIVKSGYKEAVQQYQNLAATFVDACYDRDQEMTLKMITRKMKQFKDQSCIDMALSSENMDFLVQPACVTLQRRVWRWGNLWDFHTENPEPEKLLWRKQSKSASKTDDTTLPNKVNSTVIDEPEKEIKKKYEQESIRTALKCYYLLLCVPMTMFALNGIGLLIFIYFFGLTLLGRFEQHKFHWLDAYLVSFVTVIIAEEIYEFVLAVKEKKKLAYIVSGWNIVDLSSVTLFVIGTGLRLGAFYSSDITLYNLASIAYSLDFIMFTLRLLHNCYSNPVLGPTCAMIIKTVGILTRFLYILAIFWASYAIASEAVLYPNSVLSYLTFFQLFRKAYWQMFGELFLNEIDAGRPEDTNSLQCTNDASLYGTYELLRCPTSLGRYYVPILLGAYVMFTNVLLTSLITASFTKSIEKIQQKATKLWRFQFFLLTRDFSRVLFLPLPFTLISVLAYVTNDDPRDVDGFSVTDTKSSHLDKISSCIKHHKNILMEVMGLNLKETDSVSVKNILQYYFEHFNLFVIKRHKTPTFHDEIGDILMSIKDIVNEVKKKEIRTALIHNIITYSSEVCQPEILIRIKKLDEIQEIFLNLFKTQQTGRIKKKKLTKETEQMFHNVQFELYKKRCDCRILTSSTQNILQGVKSLIESLEPGKLTLVSEVYEVKKSFADFETFLKEETLVHEMETLVLDLITFQKKESVPIDNLCRKAKELEKLVKEGSWFEPKEIKRGKIEPVSLKGRTFSETNLLDKKLKALRGIKRRLNDLVSFQPGFQFDYLSVGKSAQMNDEWKDKVQGLRIALKDYQHVYIDEDTLQMLHELEYIVLEENIKASNTDNTVIIRDLEQFVIQSCIEPSMQAEWKEKETQERSEAYKEDSKDVVDVSKESDDRTDDKNKDIRKLSENQISDGQVSVETEDLLGEEIRFYWIPMYKVSKAQDADKLPHSAPTERELKHIKFNYKDKKHNIDRRSYLGRYDLDEYKQPINPLWSDIQPENIEHDEPLELLYWGPNHFGVPIITRLKRIKNEIVSKDNKLVIEFLVEKVDTKHPKSFNFQLLKVRCSPDTDPFMEFINSLKKERRKTLDTEKPVEHVQSTWKRKMNNALVKILRRQKKRKLITQDNIHMKAYQKLKTMYIGPVKDERYMTEHKWMEIRAINYHNPNTKYQEKIDQHLDTYEWIDYEKYKQVDNIIPEDVFTNVCSHWGAYVERRPPTARNRSTGLPL
ncbi:transient receptor potential cation channel subfamily M member 2, partial [Biomphalaria glabrata]